VTANRQIGIRASGVTKMWIIFALPPVIGHVTRRMRSDRFLWW